MEAIKSMVLPRLFSTIKFRLTMWYSGLLIVSAIAFLLSFNIVITKYYQARFIPVVEVEITPDRFQPPWFRQLSRENRENIYRSRMEDLDTIREFSMLSILPLSLISFAGGYFLSDRMLYPLKSLNAKMSTITSKELTQTIPYADSGDEMSELMKNFNAMILRLKTSFDSQKQFVENASHELKTPLAVVQTNLAAALEQNGVTKKDQALLIKTAIRSTEFMSDLIEDLLLLSTLEQRIPTASVDVAALVQAAVVQLGKLAQDRRISLDLRLPEGRIAVTANEILLQRAVMNIIENAIKYSPEGKTVEVDVKPEDTSVWVSISDSGPGIPEKEKRRIFDRFYRVDTSRSKKTGGVGLGLAIAKEVVELSGGTISAESRKNGSMFRITLPRAN